MSIASRGRGLAVVGFVAAGGIGVLAASQTWIEVDRADAGEPILITGSQLMPLLAPLALAVLALGAVLALVGPVLRQIIAGLGVVVAITEAWSILALLQGGIRDAAAPAITEVTGLAGPDALDGVIAALVPTAWPWTAVAGCAVLLAAAVFAVFTSHGWRTAGRRYRTEAQAPASGPVDAVDSWDELSRGTDPTAETDRLAEPQTRSEDLP